MTIPKYDGSVQTISWGYGSQGAGFGVNPGLQELMKLLDKWDPIAAPPEPIAAPEGTAPPKIDDPFMFSPEFAVLLLQVIRVKLQETELKIAENGVKVSQDEIQRNFERGLAEIKKWAEANAGVTCLAKSGGALGWAGNVCSVLAAIFCVVAAAVTFGAASPLLVVAALILAGTAMNMASSISQANGGPALDVSSLLNRASEALLEACGMPEEEAKKAAKVLSGAIAVLIPALVAMDPNVVGGLASGIAELAHADPLVVAIVGAVVTVLTTIAVMVLTGCLARAVVSAGQLAGKLGPVAELIKRCSYIGQDVSNIVSGVLGVSSGGINIAKAKYEYTADMAQADKKAIDAVVMKLKKLMEEAQEDVEKVIKAIMEGFESVIEILTNMAESHIDTIRGSSANSV